MVVIWMLYATLVATLLVLAGFAVERAVRSVGGSSRWVWAGATALAVLVPVATLVVSDRPVDARAAASATGEAAGDGEAAGFVLSAFPVLPGPEPPAWAVRLDGVARVLWACGSGVLVLIFAGAALRLASKRTRWTVLELQGTRVRMTPETGPAVVGLVRPEVVLPRWVVDADPRSRELILAHEREHVRARDPLLVAGGLLAVLLLPWNAGLWWCFRRLREAVELDCDRRVLRSVGREARRRYGRLLVEVSGRTKGPALLPAGFAKRPSFLERRIRSMFERRSDGLVRHVFLPALTGALLFAGACLVPGPDASSSPTSLDAEEAEPAGVSTSSSRVDGATGSPRFTPFTRRPEILNADEVKGAIQEAYPALLKDAGIGGVAVLWFRIDETGAVRDVRIRRSSGHNRLDEAALEVGRGIEFSPALKGGDRVSVWVTFPVTFGTRSKTVD